MTVIKGDIIKKSEIISKFNSEVIDFAYNTVVWHSSNYPTGQGFPTNQLGSDSKQYLVAENIPETKPNASSLINALKEATRKITKLRNFRYQRYYKTNDAYALQYDTTNITVMADTLPTPNFLADVSVTGRDSVTGPGTTTPFQTITASTPSTLSSGNKVIASDVNTLISNLKANWETLKNNTLTVANYFCYTYSQWTDNRGRR